jgi:hypothetical protein
LAAKRGALIQRKVFKVGCKNKTNRGLLFSAKRNVRRNIHFILMLMLQQSKTLFLFGRIEEIVNA